MRTQAGNLTYRQLARVALYSPSVLSHAASGHRLPSLPVTLAFVRACGGDVAAWERRWHQVAGRAARRAAPTRPPARAGTALPRPAQLPLRPSGSPGRVAELSRLGRRSGEPAMPILISGPVGVGKSELALRHAHAIAAEQVDGQLYADLAAPEVAERGAEGVLEGFLQALGVAAPNLPRSLDQRIGLYRSLLAERRLVVLVDNVPDERTARTLLAPAPQTVTIVVSRQRLLGLRDVHRVNLDVLPRADSIAMLMATAEDPDLDRTACDRLAELCGDLPLALDVAARKLAARPALDLGTLISRLEQPGMLPGWLRIGDISVQYALTTAYQRLSERARTLLDYLAWQAPCEKLILNAAGGADEQVDELTESGMLRPGDNPRTYRLDALIRAFVTQRTAARAAAARPPWATGRPRCPPFRSRLPAPR